MITFRAYGGNGSTISKNTGQSKTQGDFVYNSYFESFYGLKNYFENGMQQVIKDHYIVYNKKTGRKYFFKDSEPFIRYNNLMNSSEIDYHPERRQIKKEYDESYSQAQRYSQNYRIQGSSADISKLAGVFFFQEIIKRNWLWTVKIVNMVHDEYNCEAPEELSEEVSKVLVECMERAATYFCDKVVLKADPVIGDHWIH